MKSQPPKHRKVVAKSLDFLGQIMYRENFPPKFLAMKCSDFTLDSGFVTFSNLIFFCLFRVQVYALSGPSTTEWSNASKNPTRQCSTELSHLQLAIWVRNTDWLPKIKGKVVNMFVLEILKVFDFE